MVGWLVQHKQGGLHEQSSVADNRGWEGGTEGGRNEGMKEEKEGGMERETEGWKEEEMK